MLSISNIFNKDIANFTVIKKSIEKEYQGISTPTSVTKKEYRYELESEKEILKLSIKNKFEKVEFYFVGISFVILTGLVTNQLYTSSIVSMKPDLLTWGGFFIGHIFVIASFILLILFAKELTKAFVDVESVNKTYLIIPAIFIPLFSQINSGMINLSQGEYAQIGFSSIVVGLLLVKYIVLDMIDIQKVIEPILSYVSKEVVYSDDIGLGEL